MSDRRANLCGWRGCIGCAALLLAWPAPHCWAQAGAPPGAGRGASNSAQRPSRGDRAAAQRDFAEAYARKDLDGAEDAALRWAEAQPGAWMPVWNLAAVLAARGKMDLAEAAVARALALGMTDFRLLELGLPPQLLKSPAVQDVLNNWPARQEAAADRRAAELLRTFGKAYQASKDPALRLIYVYQASPETMQKLYEQVALLAELWTSRILAGEAPADGDPGAEAKGDAANQRTDPWVIVFLPTPADFNAWSREHLNAPLHRAAFSTVAGVYDPDRFELASQDLGETFRHEFLHVLHWRHLKRSAHAAPIWVMEGLASLGEGVVDDGQGRLKPVPTWRTNSVIRLARSAGGTIPLPRLVAMSTDEFTSGKPLAHYALAHALALYLDHLDKLRGFTAALDSTLATDPTGRAALEQTLGKPIEEIDRLFRAWLRKLPEVPE
jgi:hypothetical protein